MASPRIVLMEGDSFLVRNRVSQIKKSRHPDGGTPTEWLEFHLPSKATAGKKFIKEHLNNMAAETSFENWDDDIRTILIRGLFNDPVLLRCMLEIPDSIPENTVVLVWDEHGTIKSSRSKKAESWIGFRKVCSEKGKAFDFGDTLDKKDERISIGYAMQEAEAKSVKLSNTAAQVLVSLVGKDRAAISSELDRLKVAHDSDITVEILRNEVMPLSPDYPVYFFYDSLDSGNKNTVSKASKALLNAETAKGTRWKEDIVLILALSHVRMQLATAYAAYRGADLHNCINKVCSKSEQPVSLAGLSFYARNRLTPKTVKTRPFRTNQIDQMENFVAHFSSTCPKGRSTQEWAFTRCLENYMNVYSGIFETRVSPPERARATFNRIMDEINE